jgi:S1-C subfamily serine protease
MLETVLPGIVSVTGYGQMSDEEMAFLSDPDFRRYFGLPERLQSDERWFQALGSGAVIDAEKGYILTTSHLVDGADRITVALSDTRQLPARLIGLDPGSDVAVIQVEADDLVAVPLGNSDRLRVGDYVVAIGNPFGLGRTATLGIVSALGARAQENGGAGFIQTDASINPGNSGGGLVNLRGELVGINNSVIGTFAGNSGIGFAIPITPARLVVDRLVQKNAPGAEQHPGRAPLNRH